MESYKFRALDVFNDRKVVTTISFIGFMAVAYWYWGLPSWIEIWPFALAALITILLSFSLGKSAYKLEVGLGSAVFGIPWRLGFAWVVLASIVEIARYPGLPSLTVTNFPWLLVPTVFVSGISVMIGYVSRSAEHADYSIGSIWTFIRQEIVPVAGVVIALAVLVVELNITDPEGRSKPPIEPRSGASTTEQ